MDIGSYERKRDMSFIGSIFSIRLGCIPIASLAFMCTSSGAVAEIELGASVQHTFVNGDNAFFTNRADFSSRDEGYSLLAGYRWNDFVSFELGYTNFGHAEDFAFGEVIELDADEISFSGIGHLPITERFNIFGRLGIGYWDAEVDVHNTALIDVIYPDEILVSDESSYDLFGGIGAAYNFGNNWSIRGEYAYRRWSIDDVDFDLDTLSLGFLYRF